MPTFPTLITARLTSKFGWRTHPVTGVLTFHHGIDLAPEVPGTTGVPIFATAAGQVVRRQFNTSMGNYIMIKHSGDTYTSHYLHLASYMVELGETVMEGQQIAVMGTTGGSTGIHLDFGISTAFPTVFGSPGTYVDPQVYLDNAQEPDPDYPPIWGESPYTHRRDNVKLRTILHRRRR